MLFSDYNHENISWKQRTLSPHHLLTIVIIFSSDPLMLIAMFCFSLPSIVKWVQISILVISGSEGRVIYSILSVCPTPSHRLPTSSISCEIAPCSARIKARELIMASRHFITFIHFLCLHQSCSLSSVSVLITLCLLSSQSDRTCQLSSSAFIRKNEWRKRCEGTKTIERVNRLCLQQQVKFTDQITDCREVRNRRRKAGEVGGDVD